jgi:prolipoprotein diacylglyceryltransferase
VAPQPLFLFKILGIPFFSFTTLVVGGALLALVASAIRFRAEGKSFEQALEAFAFVVFPSLFVGRLAHVLVNQAYYLERPEHLVRIADGGFAFVGIFVGGLFGLSLWCRRNARFLWAADVAAPSIAIFAACAWLGAYWHGSYYGAPAEHALALELRDSFGVILPRTPTQLLASGWSALIGLILLGFQRYLKREGSAAAVFALLYGLGLGILEFTRGDVTLYILGIRMAAWLYLVLFVAGVSQLGRRYVRFDTNMGKH